MQTSPTRRTFLLAAAAAPLVSILPAWAGTPAFATAVEAELAALEKASGGRLGVDAVDIGLGRRISYRAHERFPLCSTFKLMLTGAVLAASVRQRDLLERRIAYARDDLVSHSPITGKHVDAGMTVAELCAAAMQYSDNTAANLLIDLLGGTAAVNAFARNLNDTRFRLDRRETQLNTAIPGDPRDTSTPAAMGQSMRTLVLGHALPEPQRARLEDWMRGNTTGDRRIRAALPAGWKAGDKTGSGAHGTTNDVAILWPPHRAPISLAIYYTQDAPDAKWRDDVVAAAARAVLTALAPLR